jgi:3-dehydroquinate dehydratase/shikimate dehydrogenase
MRDVYRYDRLKPSATIYGVVADPVGHSLSPVVHNAALAAAGIDAVYVPFRVPADQLDDFLESAGRWPLAGLSVTIPHKEAILAKCTETDDLVKSIGAANTLSFSEDTVSAKNTDAIAAVESLQAVLAENEQPPNAGGIGIKTALVLGAGGAARAVAFGLKQQGIEVTVAARTAERGQKVATEVGCKAIDWAARHRMPHDCIVNATPIGMHPDVNASPFDKEHLRPYMVVFDTVYNPENTLFVKEARSVGCKIVTGVEMFVRQAAIQFRTWHGTEPPHAVMREALKRATASAKQPS